MVEVRFMMFLVDFSLGEVSFWVSGKCIDFFGFFCVYVEGSDDFDVVIEGQEVLLLVLSVGDVLELKIVEFFGYQIQLLVCFSEVLLVKMLEKEGIGWLLIYVLIIGMIVDCGYVMFLGNVFIFSFIVFVVMVLFEEYFFELVDISFIVWMENIFDEIFYGKVQWLFYLEGFYKGDEGLENQVQQWEGDIDFGVFCIIDLEGLFFVVCIGCFGVYLEVKWVSDDGEEELIKVILFQEIILVDLDEEQVELIFKQKVDGFEVIGEDLEIGDLVYLFFGQYGFYVQWGQVSDENFKFKCVFLFKGQKLEDFILEDVFGLFCLLCFFGEYFDGGCIQVGLGCFGFYVVWDKGKGEKDYCFFKGGDDVLVVGLSCVFELLVMFKWGWGGCIVFKDFGKLEGSDEMIQVYDGFYGFYVKQGKVNVLLLEGKGVDDMIFEEVVELFVVKVVLKKGGCKIVVKKMVVKKLVVKKLVVKKFFVIIKIGWFRVSVVWVIKLVDN